MLRKIKKIIQKINKLEEIHNEILKLSLESQLIQKNFLFQIKNNINSPNLIKINHIKDTGFSVFSQFDEDGIILSIFAVIGFTNKYCLDIAFANPQGANTTNLFLNWGFNGLLVCGNKSEKDFAYSFFKSNHNTWLLPPKIISSWVTIENIEETLINNNCPTEIDFFSLDMDGVDYYILQKILKIIKPRLVVVEANNIFKTDKSVAIRYKSDFNRHNIHEDYFGASIPAFVKLMKENNYKLIATNKYGFNLFFIKNDLSSEFLPEIDPNDCIKHLPTYYIEELDTRRKQVEQLDWIEV